MIFWIDCLCRSADCIFMLDTLDKSRVSMFHPLSSFELISNMLPVMMTVATSNSFITRSN